MKLSPKAKLNIIFWTITAPIIPFVLILLMLAFILALIPPFRNWALGGVENLVLSITRWRNKLPIVKNAYDKAHLFDYIRDPKG